MIIQHGADIDLLTLHFEIILDIHIRFNPSFLNANISLSLNTIKLTLIIYDFKKHNIKEYKTKIYQNILKYTSSKVMRDKTSSET